MTTETTDGTLENRLNALLAWWGVTNTNGTEHGNGQMRRYQIFASNLQEAYGDAYSRQVEGLFVANQRLVISLQQFLRCRQPQEVIGVELGIWVAVLERASQQAKAWTDLTLKVQDCCAALTSKEIVDGHKEAQPDLAD
jgi:hypothetical protein